MNERFIALDTETTGLDVKDGHRVIEIGCIEVVNRRITSNRFHYYLNPDRAIDPGALAVHGITSDFLKDKPRFSDIVDELLAFIEGAPLVIHNAPFDVGYLNMEFSFCFPARPVIHSISEIIDSLTLARLRHPGQRNSLDALCKRYNVDNSDRKLHGALMDAHLLARVYLGMTGGQSQLFSVNSAQSDAEQAVVAAAQKQLVRRSDKPLPIINPTPQELAAHHAFLAVIKKENNGLSLFDAYEESTTATSGH